MKLRSLSTASTRLITCPYDDPESPAEFEIADMLPVAIRAELRDNYSGFERNGDGPKSIARFSFAARNIEIVRYGLRSVKNLEDATGKPVELRTSVKQGRAVLTDASIELLAIPLLKDGYDTLIDWLADQIWKANSVSEEDRKSFLSQSKP